MTFSQRFEQEGWTKTLWWSQATRREQSTRSAVVTGKGIGHGARYPAHPGSPVTKDDVS
jgi:hypothetical protein